MKALFALTLALGLALAQIGHPAEAFQKALGPLPPGAKVEVENRNGRLLAATYLGSENASFLARFLEKGTGMAFGPGFLEWYGKNREALKGKTLTLNLGEDFLLELSLGNPLRARLLPRSVPESAFGQDRLILGEKGPFLRIFSDFQCPYCQRLAREVLPALKQRALKGELRLSYRHFPLTEIHPEALPAAQASECAQEQGAFWPYHDLLMAGRLGDYLGLAQALGLEEGTFARCLQSPEVRKRVEQERALALRLGLRGTPTVFAGPYKVPNPFDLTQVLDYLELAR